MTTRRRALQVLSGAGVALAAATPSAAALRERKKAPPDAVGLLYDSTKCVGCRACSNACREVSGLSPDVATIQGVAYDAPTDLDARNRTIIKLYAGEGKTAYVKAQCMHCVDPACAGACMLGALKKREMGIVSWDGSKCVGCRYCQTVCPFNVPKFEWTSLNPKIVKCELCKDRIADGKIPACAEACPRSAIVYGTREALLEEAKRRLAGNPYLYVQRVYGETEFGGTQVLYITSVPFEKLGLPEKGDEPVPEVSETVQHAVYQGFVAPVALYGILAGVLWRNRRQNGAGDEEASS
ncbi:MAG TPA: hydrogenase 2 operon protein HybA [Vicinamibacteria bacterium]|nr:hydrogenase 2 operon protein HybA [Vicinamibacteria bacterium]